MKSYVLLNEETFKSVILGTCNTMTEYNKVFHLDSDLGGRAKGWDNISILLHIVKEKQVDSAVSVCVSAILKIFRHIAIGAVTFSDFQLLCPNKLMTTILTRYL